MTITATELKNNLGKYLILAATEDIFITKNGKTICQTHISLSKQIRYGRCSFWFYPRYNYI